MWRWYSYPSLLRKQSTSALDCLTGLACAGVMVGSFDPEYFPPGYWTSSPNASVSFGWAVQYCFVPIANADGVAIRGDSCDSSDGSFYNAYGAPSRLGRYYLTMSCIDDVVPYKYAPTASFTKGFGTPARAGGVLWQSTYHSDGASGSGRLSFDFDTLTATLDARIDATVWDYFLRAYNNAGNYDADLPVNKFPVDYPNQSVSLSDLDISGNPGLVFSKAFPGSKTTYQQMSVTDFFDVYDEDRNLRWWKFDPIDEPYFVIPFNRSNS